MNTDKKNTQIYEVVHYDTDIVRNYSKELIREEPLLIRVGQEHPFCDNIITSVKKLVYDLETKTRHSDAVMIRIRKGYSCFTTPIFNCCAFFPGKPFPVIGNDFV